jgi:hypothetical protein
MVGFKQCAGLLGAFSLLLAPVLAQVPQESDFTTDDIEQGDALAALSQLASNNTDVPELARRDGTGCTPSQLRIRREWYVCPLLHPYHQGI